MAVPKLNTTTVSIHISSPGKTLTLQNPARQQSGGVFSLYCPTFARQFFAMFVTLLKP